MRDQQRGYAAGMGWVGLTVVSLVAMGQPPGPTASQAEVVSFVADHKGGVVLASTCVAVAALLMGTFLVSLARRFTAPWPTQLTLLTGAVLVGSSLTGGVLQAWLAQSAPRLEPSAVMAVWTVVYPVFYLIPPLAISWVLGCATFALRGTSLPAWVAATAGVVAVLAFVLGVAEIVSDSAVVSAVAFGGLLMTLAWTLATSIVLWRHPADDVDLADDVASLVR